MNKDNWISLSNEWIDNMCPSNLAVDAIHDSLYKLDINIYNRLTIDEEQKKITFPKLIHQMFESSGYDLGQLEVRRMISIVNSDEDKDYLKKILDRDEKLIPFKDELKNIVLKENWIQDMISWIENTRMKGYTKRDIYEILLGLKDYISYDPTTKEIPNLEDILCDSILDGFTSWGKGLKILPAEPDI